MRLLGHIIIRPKQWIELNCENEQLKRQNRNLSDEVNRLRGALEQSRENNGEYCTLYCFFQNVFEEAQKTHGIMKMLDRNIPTHIPSTAKTNKIMVENGTN